MGKSPVQPGLTKTAYERLIGPIRETARSLGYAIAVHGSLERDIDLIACPWTDGAVDECELAEAVRLVAAEHNGGIAYIDPREQPEEWFQAGCQPHGKPHGRRVWCFILGGGPYIDLSVMPRREEETG